MERSNAVIGGGARAATSSADLLRERRLRLSMSVDDVAGQLGVHPHSVLRWERRERLPGPGHVHGLARILALETADVSSFFDAVRPPRPTPLGQRGHGLRAVRTTVGLSASDLAAAAGVPVHTVYNWEHGRARVPAAALRSLAGVLSLEVETLTSLLRAAPPIPPRRDPASPLRRLRRRTGLSQETVARRIGYSRHSLGDWERGGVPPLAAVRRLAALYGVRAADVARAARVRPPALLDRRLWAPGTLHEVLSVLRHWSGLTQREVAVLTRRSVASVRAWEAGRTVPGTDARTRLERAYGLAADSLLRAYPPR